MPQAIVIGGGPAGLMAADVLLSAGCTVVLLEGKPSMGRKFLMAGKSGLNLTKIEPYDRFLAAYGPSAATLGPMLDAFGPEDVRQWAKSLKQEVFTGSTGRLFPKAMKASPLLRAWINRLDDMGLDRKTRWYWTGWDAQGALTFSTPDGPQTMTSAATVFALGGGSWSRLGSDGSWTQQFVQNGVEIVPFAPSNAGLCVNWSDHMTRHFGSPIKNAVFKAGDMAHRGEAIISARGLEGGGIYPLSPALRSGAKLTIDLFPDLDDLALTKKLSKPRGKQSQSNFLRKTLRLPPHIGALVMETLRPLPQPPSVLAQALKDLPIVHNGLRPIDEAISTAGGVSFGSLDKGLMLREKNGVFCAGEMLDWDAPTGGYLLTACLATGRWAGHHAAQWIKG